MRLRYTYKVLFCLLILQTSARTQDDVHFTQYKWVPSFQNPALSGQIDDGDMAYGIIYRDQAFTVTDNQYRSLAAHADAKFAFKNMHKLGVSLSILSDKAGDGILSSSQIGLSASYGLPLDNSGRQFLSFGVQGQIVQRSYGDLGAFTLEEALLTGTTVEQLLNQSNSYPDANLGLVYKNNFNDNSSLQGGISLHHLNSGIGSNDEETIDKYDLRYNGFIEYRQKLSQSFWLEPKIQHTQSNIFKATQIQSTFEYHPSSKSDYTFYFGMGWRVKDALQFLLGVKYKSWKVGLAYDYNTSGLRAASGNVAGLELGIRYVHYRPVQKEEIVEEPLPIIEVDKPDTTRLILIVSDSIPKDSMRILIIERGIDTKEFNPEKWPFEYNMNPEFNYEIITTSPHFIPDTLTLTPQDLVDLTQIEITLELKPAPVIEIPVDLPEEPEIIDTTDRTIYIEEAIVLDKIYYDFDEDVIITESEEEMQPLLEVMLEYPDMVIELSSHTDVRGDDDYNMDLSHRRAESAKRWLVERGISSERIIAKGYGETKLSNHCENGVYCPEPLHRKNRRTEFKIIAGPKSVRYRTDEKN